MCSGAIYWSGIRHIVYACNEGLLGEIVGRKQKESGEVKELGDKDGGLGVKSEEVLKGRAKIEGLIKRESSRERKSILEKKKKGMG